MKRKSIKWCLLTFFLLALFLCSAVVVEAEVLTVTTTADYGAGSLREMIRRANSNGVEDTIMVPAGVYLLTGNPDDDLNLSGDLDLYSGQPISIVGAGKTQTIIDGNQLDRVFHIHSGQVSLAYLSIVNGKTRDGNVASEAGQPGGGIFNAGVLYVQECNIEANTCGDGKDAEMFHLDVVCPGAGGAGGGIYNSGSLTMTQCRIDGNRAGNSGGALLDCDNIPRGGYGGGIYNSATGTMHLSACQILNNGTGKGHDGPYDHEYNNNGGDGGGICNYGTQTLTYCTISGNYTEEGGFGSYTGPESGSSGSGGGIYDSGEAIMRNCTIENNYTSTNSRDYNIQSGSGGGIYNIKNMTLQNCTIAENRTGYNGDGGGIHHKGGILTMIGCTVNNNSVRDGSTRGGGMRGGSGGGIYNHAQLVVANSTISHNSAGNGGQGVYSNGGDGGSGGGIYSGDAGSQLTIAHCTITGNTAGKAGLGDKTNHYNDGIDGNGGGIYALNGSLKMFNTIIANNEVKSKGINTDCFGTITSYGYNLIKNTTNCTLTGNLVGNQLGIDPLLGPLADNGGLTATHALLVNSPAIDAGSSGDYTNDQRDYARPIDIPGVANVNDGADIGAYEFATTSGPTAHLVLDRNHLMFGCDTAGHKTSTQTIYLSNSGSGSMPWHLSNSVPWLTCTPNSGIDEGSLSLSVIPEGLAPGTYLTQLTVEAPTTDNESLTIEVVLIVNDANFVIKPIGTLETPVSQSTVSGSIPVTGWVVDNVGIKSIKIYREPITGEPAGLIYIGNAIQVEGARPDVANLYPNYPDNTKAGWGYMLLTNFLPNGGNGSFTLHAIAEDSEGNSQTLGQTTIICDNAHAVKPFGNIDTPAQGGSASGREYVNFGWVLTPLPNMIPISGSTITVWIDGVATGHPVYNQYREDISTLFPGLYNSAGAIGYYYLDTRNLANGVHTIAWSVVDNAGNSDGIGSRYFTVQNNSGDTMTAYTNKSATTKKIVDPIKNSRKNEMETETIQVKTGYDLNAQANTIKPDSAGQMHLTINELERLEIHIPVYADMEPGTLQLVGAPIGSHFDAEQRILYWQPGVGFLGEHRLVLTYTSLTGDRQEKEIFVQITPRDAKNTY